MSSPSSYICIELPSDLSEPIVASRFAMQVDGVKQSSSMDFLDAYVGSDNRKANNSVVALLIGDPDEATAWPYLRLLNFPRAGEDTDDDYSSRSFGSDDASQTYLAGWLDRTEYSLPIVAYDRDNLHDPHVDTALPRLLPAAIRLCATGAGGQDGDFSTIVLPDYLISLTQNGNQGSQNSDDNKKQTPHIISAPWLAGTLLGSNDVLGIEGEHSLRRVLADWSVVQEPSVCSLKPLSPGTLFVSRTGALIADMILMAQNKAENGTDIAYMSQSNPALGEDPRSAFLADHSLLERSEDIGSGLNRICFWSLQPVGVDHYGDWVMTLCILSYSANAVSGAISVKHPTHFFVSAHTIATENGLRDAVWSHVCLTEPSISFDSSSGRETGFSAEIRPDLSDVFLRPEIDLKEPLILPFASDNNLLTRESLGSAIGEIVPQSVSLLKWPVSSADVARGTIKLSLQQLLGDKAAVPSEYAGDLSWLEIDPRFSSGNLSKQSSGVKVSMHSLDGRSAAVQKVYGENDEASQTGGDQAQDDQGAGSEQNDGIDNAVPQSAMNASSGIGLGKPMAGPDNAIKEGGTAEHSVMSDGAGENSSGEDSRDGSSDDSGDDSGDGSGDGSGSDSGSDGIGDKKAIPTKPDEAPSFKNKGTAIAIAKTVRAASHDEDSDFSELLNAIEKMGEAETLSAYRVCNERANYNSVFGGLSDATVKLSDSLSQQLPEWGRQLAKAYEDARLSLVSESAAGSESYDLLESDDHAISFMIGRAASEIIYLMGGIEQIVQNPPQSIPSNILARIDFEKMIEAAIDNLDIGPEKFRENTLAVPEAVQKHLSGLDRSVSVEISNAENDIGILWSDHERQERSGIIMAEIVARMTRGHTVPLSKCSTQTISVADMLPEEWGKMAPHDLRQELRKRRVTADKKSGTLSDKDNDPAPDRSLSQAELSQNERDARIEAEKAVKTGWEDVIKKQWGTTLRVRTTQKFGVSQKEAKDLTNAAREKWIKETADLIISEGIAPHKRIASAEDVERLLAAAHADMVGIVENSEPDNNGQTAGQ